MVEVKKGALIIMHESAQSAVSSREIEQIIRKVVMV